MDTTPLITLFVAIVGAIPGILALYLRLRKLKPEVAHLDASTTEKYAVASGIMSDQNIKLLESVTTLKAEIERLEAKIIIQKQLSDEYQIGTNRLVAQLVSLNLVPVWKPETSTTDKEKKP